MDAGLVIIVIVVVMATSTARGTASSDLNFTVLLARVDGDGIVEDR